MAAVVGAVRAKKKVSKRQIEIYVQCFETNEILRTGKLTPNMPPNALSVLWQELAETLNSCGDGAVREVEKWKTTFIEWKSQVRKRARDRKNMTEVEKRYLKASGLVVIEGMENVLEIGIASTPSPSVRVVEPEEMIIENKPVLLEMTDNDELINEEEEAAAASVAEVPETVTPSTSGKVSMRKPKRKQKNILLEQYIKGQDAQKEGLQAIAAALSEIAISINNLAIVIKNDES